MKPKQGTVIALKLYNMINTLIATAIALRDLNCTSFEKIDDWTLLQRKVYLSQDLGLSLGYGFSWYFHGPFSMDLMTDAIEIIRKGFGDIENNFFNDTYKQIICTVNALSDEIEKLELPVNVIQWYSLMAMMVYWDTHGLNTAIQLRLRTKHSDELIYKMSDACHSFRSKGLHWPQYNDIIKLDTQQTNQFYGGC